MVKVADAVRIIGEERGNLTASAERLGCSREWLSRMVNKHDAIREAVATARNRMLDKARTNVYVAIDEGDLDVSKWALAKLDPDYADKNQVTHIGDVTIHWFADDDRNS